MSNTAKREYFSLRVNKELKEAFYDFCKRKGLAAGPVIKMFIRRFIKDTEIPFSLYSDSQFPESHLDRLNIGMDTEMRAAFSDACESIDEDMSVVVRGFMNYCVNNNCYPYDEAK